MFESSNLKESKRQARHVRIRRKVAGTPQQPRVCVHRSLNNLYAQMIDDVSGRVLFGLSTLNKDMRAKAPSGGNIESAKKLGQAFAATAKAKGLTKVCFDRGGYRYHGRVKAFADAAREGGLEF